jgi:hypothetical protein
MGYGRLPKSRRKGQSDDYLKTEAFRGKGAVLCVGPHGPFLRDVLWQGSTATDYPYDSGQGKKTVEIPCVVWSPAVKAWLPKIWDALERRTSALTGLFEEGDDNPQGVFRVYIAEEIKSKNGPQPFLRFAAERIADVTPPDAAAAFANADWPQQKGQPPGDIDMVNDDPVGGGDDEPWGAGAGAGAGGAGAGDIDAMPF